MTKGVPDHKDNSSMLQAILTSQVFNESSSQKSARRRSRKRLFMHKQGIKVMFQILYICSGGKRLGWGVRTEVR